MALHKAEIDVFRVEFVPIVAAYVQKLGLVEEIDRLLDCGMEVSRGKIVLAMILDALSGRSPLFRLKESFADKDIGLWLGEDVSVDKLTDHDVFVRIEQRPVYPRGRPRVNEDRPNSSLLSNFTI
jgi:hypothetical protein